MSQFNSNYLKVEYKVFGKHDVNDYLDKQIERIANACGLGFMGSGYNFQTKIRDLEFDNDIFNNEKKERRIMSELCNIAVCRDCENNPNVQDPEFCIVLEYLNKEEIIKKIKETKCPECGSENWVLTDVTEH